MLDFLACQSAEKLVIDAEAIGMVKRLLRGVEAHTEPLALDMFVGINFKGNFLRQKATRQLFGKEQYVPSEIIDRGSLRTWQDAGELDTFTRARKQVRQLVDDYRRPDLPVDQVKELMRLVERIAAQAGMERLPDIE